MGGGLRWKVKKVVERPSGCFFQFMHPQRNNGIMEGWNAGRKKNGRFFIMKPKLLIVEDDDSIRTQMKWALAQDYEIFLAEDRPGAIGVLKEEQPPVVTLDLGLPPAPGGVGEGFLALAEITGEDNLTKVIVITGQGEKENALKAIGQGAYDFFCKPIQIDELKGVLGRAFYVSNLEREHRKLQSRLAGDSFEGMVGTSAKMQEVFSTIRKVATTDVPVLI